MKKDEIVDTPNRLSGINLNGGDTSAREGGIEWQISDNFTAFRFPYIQFQGIACSPRVQLVGVWVIH